MEECEIAIDIMHQESKRFGFLLPARRADKTNKEWPGGEYFGYLMFEAAGSRVYRRLVGPFL